MNESEISYWNLSPNCTPAVEQSPPTSGFSGTALYIAAFDKDLVYEPSYPWGRLLALIQVLITSTLVALFLLAVGRQFRR